jgi:hypothetical protein
MQALIMQPGIPALIPLRLIAHVVTGSIDLDDQANRGAIEIDNAPADRMLISKFQSVRSFAENLPQEAFRQRHVPPECALAERFHSVHVAAALPLHHPLDDSPPHLAMGRN